MKFIQYLGYVFTHSHFMTIRKMLFHFTDRATKTQSHPSGMAKPGFEPSVTCLHRSCSLHCSSGLDSYLSALLADSSLTEGPLMPKAWNGLERADLQCLPCLCSPSGIRSRGPTGHPIWGGSVPLALPSSSGFRLSPSQADTQHPGLYPAWGFEEEASCLCHFSSWDPAIPDLLSCPLTPRRGHPLEMPHVQP